MTNQDKLGSCPPLASNTLCNLDKKGILFESGCFHKYIAKDNKYLFSGISIYATLLLLFFAAYTWTILVDRQ